MIASIQPTQTPQGNPQKGNEKQTSSSKPTVSSIITNGEDDGKLSGATTTSKTTDCSYNNTTKLGSPASSEVSCAPLSAQSSSEEQARGRSKDERRVGASEETKSRARSSSVLSGTMTKLKSMFINEPNHHTLGETAACESEGSASAIRKNAVAVGAENSSHRAPARIQLSEDGHTHTHYLRQAKRQEKISNLLRDLLGGKRAAVKDQGQSPSRVSDAAPLIPQDQPLSLMGSLVNQIKIGEKDADSLLAYASATPASAFTEKYGKCHEVVGKGSFGIVRVAHKVDPSNNQREQLYAVKEFKKRHQESPQEYNKRLTSEFCISSSMRHPNIIQTLDLLQDQKGEYCEVMEFCAGGDLYSLILAVGKLEVVEADCFFKQIVRGVNYMHETGVAHRDLKPENILLTTNGAIKITDFGNGECFRMAWESDIHLSDGLCGSAPYIAPEEFGKSKFDPRAVDIWAIGVIYMAMRTGRHLWRMAKPGEDEYYDQYLEGRRCENGYEPIESLKRARCRNVIYSILDPIPSRRITGKQIMRSEWGRDIVVCEAGEKGL